MAAENNPNTGRKPPYPPSHPSVFEQMRLIEEQNLQVKAWKTMQENSGTLAVPDQATGRVRTFRPQ